MRPLSIAMALVCISAAVQIANNGFTIPAGIAWAVGLILAAVQQIGAREALEARLDRVRLVVEALHVEVASRRELELEGRTQSGHSIRATIRPRAIGERSAFAVMDERGET